MPISYYQQYLTDLQGHEAEMGQLFQGLATYLRGALTREELPDGKIPITRSTPIRREAEAEVGKLFFRQTTKGDFVPWETYYGRVMPLSPYMSILWRHVETATRLGVQQQAALIERALRKHPDLINALSRGSLTPYKNGQRYDPPHLVMGADNRRLRDRLWAAASDMRRKVDGFLEEAIAEGKSGREIADEVDTFLTPGKQIARSNKPYGTNAVYEVMRLGRSTISAGHHRAQAIAAQYNDFVETYNVMESSKDGCCDHCKAKVKGSPYAKDDFEHLPPCHGGCLCHLSWNLVEDVPSVIAALKAKVAALGGAWETIMPLQVEAFTRVVLDELL